MALVFCIKLVSYDKLARYSREWIGAASQASLFWVIRSMTTNHTLELVRT